MKIFCLFLLIAYFGSTVHGEAPAVAPYPARGWRPDGPAFELPTRNQQPSAPEQGNDVEVTEEELEYTGDLGTTEGTTQFTEYGVPSSDFPEDTSETVAPEDDLTVQALPSSEPAQEFRVAPSRLRNQRLRIQQTSARLQTRPGSQQFFQGAQFQQNRNGFAKTNTQFSGFSGSLRLPQNQNTAFGQQQFGRLTAPAQTFGTRNQRLRSQKQQEAPVDSYGAPVSGPPASTYGAPQNEYGTPIGQQNPGEVEDIPPSSVESTTEPDAPNDVEIEEQGGPTVAISNSASTGRYVLIQQQNPKTQKLRIIQAGAAKFRAQPAMQPVYTFDQFGQLVRVF